MRLLIIFIYFFPFLANSHEYKKNNIIIDHPILKVNSEDAKVGAGYLKIINNSNENIYIKEITSDVSKKIEIHEVIKENNVYKMRPVKKNLSILSGQELVFKNKSYHAMFFNFNYLLENNNMIDANIHFKKGLVIPIKFKILIGSSDHKHH